MRLHLRPDEFVDALDGRLPASRRAHLDVCEPCRLDLQAMQETLGDVEGLSAATPSPLFWDRFEDRVREATSALPAAEPAWRAWWKPAVAFATVAAAVVLAVVLNREAASTRVDTVVADQMAASPALDPEAEAAWSLVLALAADFDEADVREAITPAPGATDLLISELTDAQRAQLAALLQQELGAS